MFNHCKQGKEFELEVGKPERNPVTSQLEIHSLVHLIYNNKFIGVPCGVINSEFVLQTITIQLDLAKLINNNKYLL